MNSFDDFSFPGTEADIEDVGDTIDKDIDNEETDNDVDFS